MPRRNDFLEGLLGGLYDSGIGNPSVNEARRQSQMEQAFKQSELNLKAQESGRVPDQHPIMKDPGFMGHLKSILFPGSSGPTLNTAFKPDPNQGMYAQNPNGKTELLPPGTQLPVGAMRLDKDKGASLLASQNPKSYIPNVTWDTATPEQQNLAKSLSEGNIRPSDLSFRDRGSIVTLANEYSIKNKIPFQSFSGDVKAGMAKDLAFGTLGKNALSLNTALGHTASIADAYEKLGNTDVNFLNQPLNQLRTMTNDPNVVALGLNLNSLRGELANVFKNGGGTDQEISQWSSYLNESLTPAQFHAAAEKIDELLRSRLDSLEYQQKDVMGKAPSERKLLSPKGAATMDKFKSSGGSSPKDQAAIEWAKSHPLDPRAMKIKKMHGMQ